MIVVGGAYLEECDWPAWRQLMGPGVRAALALSQVSPGGELFTYIEGGSRADLVETMLQRGVTASTRERKSPINFHYKHPLTSPPHLEPEKPARQDEPLSVSGKVVLAFPMFESRIIVNADRAVFEIAYNEDGVAPDDIACDDVASLTLIAAEDEIPAPNGDFRDTALALMAAHSADLMIVRKRVGGGDSFRWRGST